MPAITPRAWLDDARALLDALGDAVVVVGDDGLVAFVNEAASVLLGWSASEATGRACDEVLPLRGGGGQHPLDVAKLLPRGAKPCTLRGVSLASRGGATGPLDVTLARPEDARAGLVVTLRDAGDARAAAEALAHAEESLRAALEAAPVLAIVHRGGRVAFANGAAYGALAYAPGELAGRDVAALVASNDRGALEGGERAESGRTVRVMKKDGHALEVQPASVAIAWDGAPATLIVARDVTVAAALQEQLVRADRLAALGTLAAGVAHEINNPLTYVLVNIEHVIRQLRARVAAGEPLDVEEIDAHVGPLAQALDGATRVRGIVRDLQTFSRGHVDKKGFVDVRRVVEASLEMTAHELRHRARVERRLRDVPPVVANEARLGQVFLNLLVNAAHAIPEGDVATNAVTVETDSDGESVVVVVRDTGEGIAPEHLAHVFDPFFTTSGESAGLGLSIAHGIVESFGGTLTVRSAVGEGSEFCVTLPAAPGYDATRSSRASLLPAPLARRRVLVIDEDVHVADAIAMSLRDEHDVDVTTSARDALGRLARGDRYDVILCDLMMPDMTGMDLYREALRVAPQVASRIVFLSGGVYTPRARAFVEGLPNRCLEKPPDLAKLREIVRRRGA